jgi:hypothetical protein
MNCPLCNNPMIDVVYGLPTDEMIEKSNRDEIILGGYRKPFGPTHYCLPCETEYGQDEDTRTPKFYHNN